MPIVELAKPPRCLAAYTPLCRSPSLDSKPIEMVRTPRDCDTTCDLEGLHQALTRRNEIELEPVSTLEPAVYRRHEVSVALPSSRCPADVAELVLPEALPDMKWSDRPRPRLPINSKIDNVHSGTRNETKRGVESVTDSLVLERDVPQIIGIIDFEPGSRPVTSRKIASSCREPPQSH